MGVKFNPFTGKFDFVGSGGGGAVDSVNGNTGVVVLDQDDIGDGTTYKQYSQTEKTKLNGIESGAEVNNISDANATDLTDGGDSTLHYHASDRNRANHTGTQTSSTISDFIEAVSDQVAALIQDGDNLSWTYDDAGNSLTANVLQRYNYFIYNSSGSQTYPEGNRFNDWGDLMTHLQDLEGAKTIQFEQDETIPAGSYNLDNVLLKGNGLEYNAGGFTITFGDNTTISSWRNPGFNSLLLKSTSTTGHICTFSYGFNLLCDTVTNVQSSSSYEFFASSYAGQNIIALRNSARWSLVGGSTKPLFKFTGSAFGQQIILSRGDGSVVNHNTLSSTNAQILIDVIGSVNQNLASYPITNSGLSVGFFLPLTLTNISAAAFYVQNKATADSPYTLTSETGYLRCNANAGNMTVNLPAAVGNGRLVTIKKIDASANTVTIDGNGSETIDGATTKVLTTQYESIQMIDAAAGVWDIIT